MNTIFSFRRIGLILRADWIEHRRSWTLKMGLLLLVYVFMFWDEHMGSLIGWTSFISAIMFFTYMGKKIHGKKGLFLTLPANNPEKFMALWLVALFHFASCLLIFGGAEMVNILIYGDPAVEFLYDVPNTGTVSLMVFFTCWLFASYMTFRKSAGFIGMASFVFLMWCWLIISISLITDGTDYDFEYGLKSILKVAEYSETFYFVFIYLLCAALLYYSYRKLSKKQIK